MKLDTPAEVLKQSLQRYFSLLVNVVQPLQR